MIAEDKQRLRSSLRQTLRKLPPSEKVVQSEEISNILSALPLWAGARRIFAFHPLQDEPAIFPLLIASNRLHLPRIDSEVMRFYPVSDPQSLRPGSRGILQPDPIGGEAQPTAGDLLLVPGLAFSSDGCRLGRGGGFYDRFLVNCPAATLGICFRQQVLADLPMAAHDQRVDRVIFPG